ncbi:phage holin family protein [Chitiniphilus purpureus]|uniref:Phage holin family protein n=1 Tax=Chitiniphilus purpureus TaxID=2981137 RepID=A0ABY6DQT4_9NEIS|nr:phage holin family protein [Chitiniphilus sp. CD1]UXY16734.1 phage holin family protein [Chitiniphilus sp. CD1]
MPEPITTSSVSTFAFIGAVLVGLFPGVDAGVALAAFAGAVLFVGTSAELGLWSKLLYLVVSLIAGCLAASFAASLLGVVLLGLVNVDRPVGALIAAASAVRLLLWLIRRSDDPSAWLDLLRGRKQ